MMSVPQKEPPVHFLMNTIRFFCNKAWVLSGPICCRHIHILRFTVAFSNLYKVLYTSCSRLIDLTSVYLNMFCLQYPQNLLMSDVLPNSTMYISVVF